MLPTLVQLCLQTHAVTINLAHGSHGSFNADVDNAHSRRLVFFNHSLCSRALSNSSDQAVDEPQQELCVPLLDVRFLRVSHQLSIVVQAFKSFLQNTQVEQLRHD